MHDWLLNGKILHTVNSKISGQFDRRLSSVALAVESAPIMADTWLVVAGEITLTEFCQMPENMTVGRYR